MTDRQTDTKDIQMRKNDRQADRHKRQTDGKERRWGCTDGLKKGKNGHALKPQ